MAQPVLTRLERDVWRNKQFNDATQVPAIGAIVAFFYQGATTSMDLDDPIVPGGTAAIEVYDRGTVFARTDPLPAQTDIVQVGTIPSSVLTVIDTPINPDFAGVGAECAESARMKS